MEKINEVVRKKEIFKMSVIEFKKGDWLNSIVIDDNMEVTYKVGYLTIQSMTEKEIKN